MPLIQGGPPEWIWERTKNLVKWEVVPSPSPNGHPLFELRAQCGLEIMRLQFFTENEIKELRAMIDEGLTRRPDDRQGKPVQSGREPAVTPEQEPNRTPVLPEAERPPESREGVVSDPDFAVRH